MSSKLKPADRIRTEIEQRIAAGDYLDGEKLNEVALAEQFAVSRTPLREALQALRAVGLVELIPNRGAFVRRPSMTRLVEMFEMMAQMEGWCVKLATRRVTAAQRLYMGQAARDCESALAAGQIDAYYAANNRLHHMIYQASGNAFLAEETENLYRRLDPFRRRQLDMVGRLEQSMSEHTAILEAMDLGDEDRASELMRLHVNTLGATYSDYLTLMEGRRSSAG
ncbi:GntR family transcriptional regulator (plasmid) [Paroceanicella profunda]|uniref:GntR family transcriptional regulator n=1 Tax=Paroceanicella profunda TaxID=2579971 RepID=A0A5B8G4F5_9RHOB|nr:GntR family transcriptional regulator [Paroceanicella profunda]QDL94974.1 GntR family transcriptional regulator [Paroceanicella profunda]